MFFNFKYGKKKAQERLRVLWQRNRLKRVQVNGINTYYLDKKPGMISHLVGVNWVRLWYEKNLQPGEQVYSFSYEVDYKPVLRTDGFIAIKNNNTGKYRFSFIEFDNAGGTKFDKITKYNKLYQSSLYERDWWLPFADGFPTVTIVTFSQRRKNIIKKKVKKHGLPELNFNLLLLADIK